MIDSWYDSYVGVVMLVRVKEGTLHVKDKIQLMATGATHLVEQLGVFSPRSTPREMLQAGEVGFIIAGIKEIRDARVGDTVTLAQNPATDPLPGFKQVKPQVFAGLYPVEASEYDSLRDALEKLQLNDASLHLSLKSPRRSASVSAPGSLASFTWISCRSAWSVNTTRTSSRRHRPWCMK